MDSLPNEILVNIVDHLEATDAQSLGRLNSTLLNAAAHKAYSEITLCIAQAPACISFLTKLGVAHYVRAIRVESNAFFRRDMIYKNVELSDKDIEFGTPYILVTPLLNYIASLRALEDLYWAAELHIPGDLVQALEAKGCRLHMQRWYPDHDEIARIAQSSALYSIDGSWITKTSWNDQLWYGALVLMYLDQVSRAARSNHHIKELSLNLPLNLNSQSNPQPVLAMLKSLKVTNVANHNFRLQHMADWIDLRVLEVFHIDTLWPEDAEWMGSCGLFHNLRDLKVKSRMSLDHPLQAFLPQLSLEKLEIGEAIPLSRADLVALLAQSRDRLRRLSCPSLMVNKAWVAEHLEPCWRLEELNVTVYQGKNATLSPRMTRLLATSCAY